MGFYDQIGEKKVNKTLQIQESTNRAYTAICQAITGKQNSFTQVTTELINTFIHQFRSESYFKDLLPAKMYELTIKETFGIKDIKKIEERPITMATGEKFVFQLLRKKKHLTR